MGRITRSGGVAVALDLLDRSRATLVQACRADTTNDRYISAHLGALRAAAALLAIRSNSSGRSGSVVRAGRGGSAMRNVWEGVGELTPELGEWVGYFAECGSRRSSLESGTGHATVREADDLLRAAETFLGLVQAALGLPIMGIDASLAVTEWA